MAISQVSFADVQYTKQTLYNYMSLSSLYFVDARLTTAGLAT